MGESISTTCRYCGDVVDHCLGIGMSQMRLDVGNAPMVGEEDRFSFHHSIKDVISPEELAYLQSLDLQDVNDLSYSSILYACPRCEILSVHVHVRFQYDGFKIYEVTHRCKSCQSRLNAVSKDISEYRCAQCGSKALVKDEHRKIMWD